MSIEEMVSWHVKLSSVEVRMAEEPLKEVKNKSKMLESKTNGIIFTPKEGPSSAIKINQPPTPKIKNNRTTSGRQFFHKTTLSQHENKTDTSFTEKDTLNKEASELSDNLVHYMRFIHRILKFLGPPNQVQLP